MTRHTVVPASDLPPGSVRSFLVGSRRIVVANVDGDVRATDELCPHLAVPLSQGRIDGRCLTCVGHGSTFDLDDGSVKRWMGRRPGLIATLVSGKPLPLSLLPCEVSDGMVHVDL